jgi:hypothetical protein
METHKDGRKEENLERKKVARGDLKVLYVRTDNQSDGGCVHLFHYLSLLPAA